MRAMLPDTEGKVDSEGVKLHYEIYGSGDHTIVFVPTWAITHSRVWKAQVPYFAEHFRVITYDPRGNGLSDRPSEPAQYSTAKIVRDVIAVMDQTNTDKAILVGLSFSCQISFAVAAHYPNRVTAVVSTGGSSGLVPSSQDRTDAYQNEPVPKPTGWEKFNASYWQSDYPDFFMGKIHNEPHSTKLHEDTVAWGLQGDGLTDVEIVKIDTPVILESANECLRFEQESFGVLHQMLGKLDADAKQKAWDDVEIALQAYQGNDGFRGPCTMIAASGTKA